jgi:hypothetical protein
MENEIMNNKTGLIAAAVFVTTFVAAVITWKKIAKRKAKMVEAEYEETVVEENDSEN